MANYSELIASVKLAIKQNGVKAITGQLLQDVLVSMLNSIGRYSLYAGVAIPSTNPGITDQSAFYLASTPGTYVNFAGYTVEAGEIVVFYNSRGGWFMDVIARLSGGGIVNVDPALSDTSTNPVENRVITDALNDMDERVTALEEGGGGGGGDQLYEHFIYLRIQGVNRAGYYTFGWVDKSSATPATFDDIPSGYYKIKQAWNIDAGGVETTNAIAIDIAHDRTVVIDEMLSTSPFLTTWNVPPTATYSIIKASVGVFPKTSF